MQLNKATPRLRSSVLQELRRVAPGWRKNNALLALALTAAMYNVHASSPTGGPARRPVHRSFLVPPKRSVGGSAGGSVNEGGPVRRSLGAGGCGDLTATFNSTPPHFPHK